MNTQSELGKLIPENERRRDAIHVAVAPAVASTRLEPGQHVGFVEPANTHLVGPSDEPVGIADPFLTETINQGERFWILLYPNSVTGMRHVWTHPAYTKASNQITKSLSHRDA